VTEAFESGAVVDGVDLDAVAIAVRACSAVADLYTGPTAESVATYLPGRRISGLKLARDAVTIQVRSLWDVPAVRVAGQIRPAVRPYVGGRRIDVVIADLTPPPGYGPVEDNDRSELPVDDTLSATTVEDAAGGDALVEPVPVGSKPASISVKHTVTVEEKVVVDEYEDPALPWVRPNGANSDASSFAPTTRTEGEIPPSS